MQPVPGCMDNMLNMKNQKLLQQITTFQITVWVWAVAEIMEEEYCLINEELLRVRKYTKKKEIRDVIIYPF